MKIYTRTGDGGDTTLFDGTRIAKSDARVDAYGEVDEANAAVGVARASGVDKDIEDMLARSSATCSRSDRVSPTRPSASPAASTKIALGPDDVARLEGWIDKCEEELTPLRRFILPGGTPAAAALHLARTVCRRAERRMVALASARGGVPRLHEPPVGPALRARARGEPPRGGG